VFVASLDMRTSTYVMLVLVLNGLRWEVITCTRFVDIAGIVDRLKLLFIVNNHNCNKRKLYLIKSLKWALMWNIHQSNLINIRFLTAPPPPPPPPHPTPSFLISRDLHNQKMLSNEDIILIRLNKDFVLIQCSFVTVMIIDYEKQF
jgi:hypothetical protein